MTQPIGAKTTKQGRKYEGLPSVTTVLGIINKPGLSWGAAKETALFAVHHPEEWQHLSPEDAVSRLYRHHKGVWTDKGARGTEIHTIAQQWTNGEAVDVPVEYTPYVDALEAFYNDHRPTWIAVERTVIDRRRGYGGTFDAIAQIGDRLLLIDLKTGKRYPAEVVLQLAAYRFAEAMAIYDEAGALVNTEPMPEVDGAAVVYLHDDGTYEMLELPADEKAMVAFMAALELWKSMAELEAWVKRHPEIKSTKEVAA
ncbi:MAG TPA: PD-(D/E)XK nuclease family protein [Acidimicrobiales bacterium]|nr:PD-(D/E)XK nuclease family protein [Acidimicrobiales bacterium]